MKYLQSIQSLSKQIHALNNVIVFDYDDTLFPTTKFKEIMSRPTMTMYENQFQETRSKMTDEEIKDLIELSWVTFNLLKIYIEQYSMNNICIVSASENSRIQHSLGYVYDIGYFKQIYNLLFDHHNHNKISIYHPSEQILKSFRSKKVYNNLYEHPAFIWKYRTFKKIFAAKYVESDHTLNTFTFIGDSECEYQAAKQLNLYNSQNINGQNNVIIDQMKFVNKPSIRSLIQQQTSFLKNVVNMKDVWLN